MNNFLYLTESRKSDSAQLWIVGCSFSHGSGVNSNERYGQLLSDKLNLPVTFLTQPGSSIRWAADQILRSDIRKDDIVVWGLTGVSRFPYLDESNILHHVNTNNFNSTKNIKNYFQEQILVSNHLMYDAISSTEQVFNFLKKISSKFILAAMPCNTPSYDLKIYNYVSNLDYAIMLYDIHNYSFIDVGHDQQHPGPKQHQIYAQKILKAINEDKST